MIHGKILTFAVVVSLMATAGAQSKAKKPAAKPAPVKTAVPKKSAKPRPTVNAAKKAAAPLSAASAKSLSEALGYVRAGQCERAVPLLYTLSRRGDLSGEKMQIKYLLGSCLMEMKLYQVAAFQFVDVIRQGEDKYTKQAIEKLSIVADQLGDDTLLNYAISKVQLEDFPAQNKDIIYFRLGEVKMKRKQFPEAAELFAKVPQNSRYASQAKFSRGLAFLEYNRPADATRIFKDMLASRSTASVTDPNRVAALLALARAHYQAQQWDEALEYYRQIPRDTEAWHDVVFESAWAYLRGAKFRSALSQFQTLHSSYYEDYYLPEALLLRAIVYLYICKYDEMEKVLNLYEKTYNPIQNQLAQFVQANRDPLAYFSEIEKAANLRRDRKISTSLKIPYGIARHIMDEGDVKRSLGYLRYLTDEKKRIESNPNFMRSTFGAYALKVIASRGKNTRNVIGEMTRIHISKIQSEMKDLYEQAGFIRYEMINGRKESLRKKIAGKDIPQVDEQIDRTFYVQNGYEYWPFENEYWLDELGNYHYLGKQSCE